MKRRNSVTFDRALSSLRDARQAVEQLAAEAEDHLLGCECPTCCAALEAPGMRWSLDVLVSILDGVAVPVREALAS
jgi:signal transduction protein with GAF and PtsI domain